MLDGANTNPVTVAIMANLYRFSTPAFLFPVLSFTHVAM